MTIRGLPRKPKAQEEQKGTAQVIRQISQRALPSVLSQQVLAVFILQNGLHWKQISDYHIPLGKLYSGTALFTYMHKRTQ